MADEERSVLFSTVLPIAGTCTAFVTFIASAPATYRAWRTGNIGQLDPIPLSVLTVNNLGWVVYGAFVKDIGVTVTNAIGLVLLFAYVVALLPLANAFQRKFVQIVLSSGVLLWNVIGLIVLYAIDDYQTNSLLTGVGATAVLFAFYTSPLLQLRKVIKTKDASSLNFPLVAAILLNTAVWIVYGLGINNPFVYLPNIFGGLLNVAQMVLIVMYRKNKSRVGAEMLNDEADDDLQAELPDQQDPDTDV